VGAGADAGLTDLSSAGRLLGRVVQGAHDHHRRGEPAGEVVLGQLQGDRDRGGDLGGQQMDGREVTLHGSAELGGAGRPLVGPVERHALADQRVVGSQVVAHPVTLLEVALLLLVGVEVLHAKVEPAPVARRPLYRYLGLALPRPGKEPAGLGEGVVDQLLVDPVAGQVGEADVTEGADQLQGGPLALGRVAVQEGPEVDHGDLVEGEALGAEAGRDRWRGHGATPMRSSTNLLVAMSSAFSPALVVCAGR
jgi:hypothetical protein